MSDPSSDDGLQEARKAIASLDVFSGIDPEDCVIERLGGLTNLVFHVNSGKRAFCLRIPGKGTEEYIDREVEGHNAVVAAETGVSPEVLYFNADSGIMVAHFIEDIVTMTPELFAERSGAPGRAARAFKQLHSSRKSFEFRFELFAMIDDYLKHVSSLGASLPEGYNDVVSEAEGIRQALSAHPIDLAPCHCDPLCENFLDDGKRMWIVDWEYSGMNDPLWDLGDLSVEAGFSEEQDLEMMAAYYPEGYRASEYGRMIIYKAMCDLLWTLWGLIQHANDNPVEDFWAYATNRFERCKKLMAQSDFAGHVAAVRENRS